MLNLCEMIKKLFFLGFIAMTANAFSQERELVSMSYDFMPSGQNQVDFSRYRVALNFPMKTKRGFITNGLAFSHYRLYYDNTERLFVPSIEKLYAANYNLNYIQGISDDWMLGVNALVGIQSNLRSGLNSE